MKKQLALLSMLISGLVMAQTPCVDNFAGGFPCNDYDLQSTIDLSVLDSGIGNDSWGWTDSTTGKEYAIVGLGNGTAFIDISDPVNPVYLGKLPTHTSSSIWRDIKVYSDHAFIVSEASGHGMQVFDLTQLRDVSNPPVTFSNTAHYGEFGRAHNIVINEETGFAYAVGSGLFGGGPHFIDITNPANPVNAGGFADDGYTHDAQVVIYDGPDTDYIGQEIYFGSNESILSIVDVTVKNNPIGISTSSYSNVGYTHQAWLTEDHRYLLLGDEFDEFNVGFPTRTVVIDVTDLDNPVAAFDYFGPTDAVDHNGYIVGDKYYLANYTAGLRVVDISDLDNQNMEEIGYFDAFPSNDNVTTSGGSWSVYPFFASGNIVISDQDQGFLLVKQSETLGVEDQSISTFSLSPNPARDQITITAKEADISSIRIFNILGQEVLTPTISSTRKETINVSSLNAGVYLVQINNNTTKRLVIQ